MTLSITKDHYFDRQQPAKTEELRNVVRVTTQPLTAGDLEQVYLSDTPVVVPAKVGGVNGTVTIEIVYQSCPVINATVTIENATAGVSIVGSPSKYAWGASVTLENTAGAPGSADIYAEGNVLRIEGEQTVEKRDTASIASNGTLLYEFPMNHLIQSKDMADLIAANLLASYKDPRKDVSITWRGNPAVELGDVIEVPIYQRGSIDNRGNFIVTKNKIEFSGALKMTTDGRKTT